MLVPQVPQVVAADSAETEVLKTQKH